MIEKSTIIFTSLGRTGTKFFYTLFDAIILNGTSLHEPDVFNIVQYRGVRERLKQIVKQLQESGVSNLVMRKALGQWSLVELSDARVRGDLEYSQAVQQVLRLRQQFVQRQNGYVYIESNIGYYGLIDVLKEVYLRHRVVYIVRDGRDWIRSNMNWGQMYNKGRMRSLLAHTWPTALEIEDDLYRSKWEMMSRFEKLCWAWSRLNKFALDISLNNPNARVFRFEDIFESREGYGHLVDLVKFATASLDAESRETGSLEGWLDRQIHKSEAQFPDWEEWSAEQKQQFQRICNPLMEELNYW